MHDLAPGPIRPVSVPGRMFASRLFWTTFATIAAPMLLASAGFAWVISEQISETARVQVLQRLHDVTVALEVDHGAGLVEATADVRRKIEEIHRETGARITLIAESGTVIADTDTEPALLGNHGDRPEIVEAQHAGAGTSQRLSDTTDEPMLYYARRAGSAESPLGYVRASVPLREIRSAAAPAQTVLWWAAAGTGLVGLLVAGLLATRIVWGAETFTHAARAVGSGELDYRVHLPRRDQFASLAAAFNRMSEELESRTTALERKSRELEENSERLQTVLGSMIEGVLAVDESQRVLFANKAARALLDLSSARPVQRPLWETVRNPRIQEVVREALAGKERISVEFEIPRKQAIVALLATRLPGEPCPGVVLVLHDVTELRRLENLRREFVSNVSHELKTPLTSIRAYTETLLDGAIDDPAIRRQFLQRIEEQADRLHALIIDLLQLARIESGQEVYELAVVGLEEPVRACLEAHAAIAAAKNVDLRAEPPGREVRVRADVEGLQAIFSNLVDNAIKYTPAGGSVAVRWDAVDGQALIQVQDTGPGIAPKHQSRIFERFYRADKARSRQVGGTGLGLSIVKHLTQVFGGTVEVESEVGRGSTFSVRLPLA